MAELRRKMLTRIEAGDTPTAVARNFRVACSTVYNVKKLNIDALKTSVDQEWAAMLDTDVIKATKAFRRRLESCVAANGGIFEKK